MRRLFASVVVVLMLFGLYFFVASNGLLTEPKLEQKQEKTVIESMPQIKSKQQKKQLQQLLKGELMHWIGKKETELIEEFNEPVRKDKSAYGYTWWVYTDGQTEYIQFGIEAGIVQTIYATGQDVSIQPFQIGSSYEETKKKFPLERLVSYKTGASMYNFILSADDVKTQPLVKLADDLFAQLYFDTFTNRLSSIRLLSSDILLRHRFYEMEYRGSLPEEMVFSNDEWNKIEKGMTQQIFDLTNIIRNRHDLNALILDEQVNEVAFLHSKDMEENNYFSHYRLDGSGLKDRLAEKEIYYLAAGENIAAQHVDAPAAVEGWLNSEGHREAMLNEEYTHIGVGVYRLYYTQNFLLKP